MVKSPFRGREKLNKVYVAVRIKELQIHPKASCKLNKI
jgi:hypothetical protein